MTTALNDHYQEGQAFAGTAPAKSLESALETVTEVFSDAWSLDALMSGLTCTEANAMIELFRAMDEVHMAEVALTAHAAQDDDPDDQHYINDSGSGRYRED